MLSDAKVTLRLAPIIVAAVVAAEDMLNATGPEKKAAALTLVDAGVAALNAASGQPVVDPAFARELATRAIDALVATANAWSRARFGY